jgi:hypothetical protein
MIRPCALLGATALVGFLATPSQATPIVEQTLVATGGDVVVTFDLNDAGYMSELFLEGAYGDQFGALFNNWTTAVGTSLNLGSFASGTELVFKLVVQQTGNVFYTGDPNRNVDGLVHAVVGPSNDRVLVGFEDMLGGGDFDYNDLVFAFSNVAAGGGSSGAAAAVDEPSTLVLLGGGLSLLVALMRRQGSKA